MIIFILNTLLSLAKVLMYSWVTDDQILFKVITIMFLILILYLSYIYPKPLKSNINSVAEHYKIHNCYEKAFCFLMLFLYFVIFIGGIFYLRFKNSNKFLDLTLVFNNFFSKILLLNLLTAILSIILILLLMFVYIVTLIKLVNLFKKYWVKLHIYYQNHNDYPTWYDKFMDIILFKLSYYHLISLLCLNYPKIIDNKVFGFRIDYHLILLIRKIHYIIIGIIFIYDMMYNNYVMYNLYAILPYIFIYDLYLQICNLYANIDHLYSADSTAHNFIYANTIEILDKEIKNRKYILIDDEYYDVEHLAKIILIYLPTGLNAELLCKAIDGEDFCKLKFTKYNYYKDWKKKR